MFRCAALAFSFAALFGASVRAEPVVESEVTLVLAGDTGLNGSFQPVYASYGTKQGMRLAWADSTALIAREINGDINFANLETVVTDRNDLSANLKLFGFRTHPSGVRHLMQIGFNAFSTANNHSMDFGLEGGRETLRQLAAIGGAHAGLGLNRDAARAPRLMIVKRSQLRARRVGVDRQRLQRAGGRRRPARATLLHIGPRLR